MWRHMSERSFSFIKYSFNRYTVMCPMNLRSRLWRWIVSKNLFFNQRLHKYYLSTQTIVWILHKTNYDILVFLFHVLGIFSVSYSLYCMAVLCAGKATATFYDTPRVFTAPGSPTTTSDKMAAESQGAGAEEVLMEHRESSATGTGCRVPAARDKPVCLIVLGMAGSGKTTFVQVRPRTAWVSNTASC